MATKTTIDLNPITIGPVAAQVKKQVSPKRWSRLVKQAHSRGFAINSYLDPTVPDPLKQRTSESLRKQATSTIAAAYKPAEVELSQQERTIKSIQAKRQADNEYYKNWLAAKNAELQTQQQAATSQLVSGIDALHQNTANAYANQQGQLRDSLGQQPGSVSDYSQSNALNVDLSNEQQRGLAQIAAQGEHAMTSAAIEDKSLAATQANTYAFLAAQAAKQSADSQTQLSKVADAKTKLLLDKAAAANDEVSKLLANEATKAQSVQNTAVAADKLGVDLSKLALQRKQTNANITHTQAADALAGRTADERHRHNLATEAAANVANGIQDYKAHHPSKGKGKGTAAHPTDPQKLFDLAYAGVVGGRNKADGNRPYTVGYVQAHPDIFAARLQSAFKISPEMAKRVVIAFIKHGGKPAGSFKQYAGQSYPVAPNPLDDGPAGFPTLTP